MIQTIPVKETRERLADLINQVEVAGKQFIITKFGQPKAMLVPVTAGKEKKIIELTESFGIWKRRKDLDDANLWVAKLRHKMSRRNV